MPSSVNAPNGPQQMGYTSQTNMKSLGQKDFLAMLVAQVKNQDPMQSQANGEFLSQLAQFSTNDGISRMEQSLEQLATSLQSNQALQASALVGSKVLVKGDKLSLGDEGSVNTAIDFVPGVTNLTASIFSESGALIKKIQLGQPDAGFYQFAWDGTNQSDERMPAGKYRVEVHGVYGGQEVAFKTYTTGNVDSVSLGQNGEGLKLNVSGIGAVTLDQIRQIMV